MIIKVYLFFIIVSIDSMLLSMNRDIEINMRKKMQIFDALERKDFFDVYRLLSKLERNNDIVNALDRHGNAPLHYYVDHSFDYLLKLLLEKGVYLDVVDSQDRTPLLKAAEIGNFKALRRLLECGAQVKFKTNQGQSILHKIFSQKRLIKQLNGDISYFEKNLSFIVSLVNQSSETLKNLALKKIIFDNKDISEKMHQDLLMDFIVQRMRYKEKTFVINKKMQKYFFKDLTRYILEEESKTDFFINHQDRFGNTALHCAVKCHAHPKIIKLLVKNGANRLIENNFGKKAYELLSMQCECRSAYDSHDYIELYTLLSWPMHLSAFYKNQIDEEEL
jgi:ankyrin repeat protein